MSKDEWEQEEFPEPNPKFRSSAERAGGQPAEGETAELTHVMPEDLDLQPTDEVTQSMFPETGEITEDIGPGLISSLSGDAETEDVFVLLPETDAIPVVPVEEIGIENEVTELGFDDDPAMDVTEDVTGEFLGGARNAGDPDSTSLDDLTTDIDDDLLAMGAEASGDYDDFDADEGDDSFEAGRRGGRRRSSGRFVRTALLLCLLLLTAAGGIFVLDPPQLREFLQRFRPGDSGTDGGAVVVDGGEDPAVDPTDTEVEVTGVEVVTPPVDPGANDPNVVDAGSDPSDLLVGTEMDYLAASRQFFRERVILAFQLGYVGEAEHE